MCFIQYFPTTTWGCKARASDKHIVMRSEAHPCRPVLEATLRTIDRTRDTVDPDELKFNWCPRETFKVIESYRLVLCPNVHHPILICPVCEGQKSKVEALMIEHPAAHYAVLTNGKVLHAPGVTEPLPSYLCGQDHPYLAPDFERDMAQLGPRGGMERLMGFKESGPR